MEKLGILIAGLGIRFAVYRFAAYIVQKHWHTSKVNQLLVPKKPRISTCITLLFLEVQPRLRCHEDKCVAALRWVCMGIEIVNEAIRIRIEVGFDMRITDAGSKG